jgi:hypothetical protein
VLSQAYPGTADPNGKDEHGSPITAATRHQVTADLVGMVR